MFPQQFPPLSNAILSCCHGDVVTLHARGMHRHRDVLSNYCLKTGHCGNQNVEIAWASVEYFDVYFRDLDIN